MPPTPRLRHVRDASGRRARLGGLRWACGAAIMALAILAAPGCGDPYADPLSAGSRKVPDIRVRLGKERAHGQLEIIKQPWKAAAVGGGWRAESRSGTRGTILLRGGKLVVAGQNTNATRIVIEPRYDFVLDEVQYTGTLRVRATREGKIEFVNELDMETYVAGVIGNEVGPTGAPSTYRAQAVAARTYAYMRLQRPGAATKDFHLFDSAASQVYRGQSPRYGVKWETMERHTRATAGVIMMYAGRPFRAYYASTCGGHTTEARTSALDPGHAVGAFRGVRCRYCTTSKYFTWDEVRTEAEIIAGMKRIGRPILAPIHAMRASERGAGDWVAEFEILYGPGRKTRTVPGHQFRTALKLRSHKVLAMKRVAGGWSVGGRGWGHGVGMCQVGAINMGKGGATETEILGHYYPGATFRRVY